MGFLAALRAAAGTHRAKTGWEKDPLARPAASLAVLLLDSYSSVCKSSLTRSHAVVRSDEQSVANATIPAIFFIGIEVAGAASIDDEGEPHLDRLIE